MKKVLIAVLFFVGCNNLEQGPPPNPPPPDTTVTPPVDTTANPKDTGLSYNRQKAILYNNWAVKIKR